MCNRVFTWFVDVRQIWSVRANPFLLLFALSLRHLHQSLLFCDSNFVFWCCCLMNLYTVGDWDLYNFGVVFFVCFFHCLTVRTDLCQFISIIFLTEALPFFILPMYQYYYSIRMYSIILKCNYLHTVYRYVSDIFKFLYFSSFFIYYHRRLSVSHLSPCYYLCTFL